MDPTKRIIVNTIVQYSRSVLNIFLSLFSTRYIVEALGNSDYGLYVVVGGVVALLGFITNALVVTTQRFISYSYGKSDLGRVHKVFVNSLFIHIVVSLLMVLVLFCLKDFIIVRLNIPDGRFQVASDIYLITILMLFVTIMIAPFKALFIARENIVYISLVEICDGFLKLGVALWILFTTTDRLLLFALLMMLIQVFNLSALAFYAIRKYEECRLPVSLHDIDFSCIRELAGFAGWSTYGMGAIVARSQGIQLLLNRVYGTVINAAYGIAFQILGAIMFVSTSVLNAMNPQIVKAESEGNREKMLHLAEMESKYSTMLLMLIIVPFIFEAPAILSLWLKEVPENADLFCRFLLCAFIIDQSTYGLNTANQAMGKIRIYTLLMYTPKLLILIPVYLVLRVGGSPFWVMCLYLASEALVSSMRLPYIKYTCGMSIRHYLRTVIIPLLPLLIVQCLIGYICIHNLNFQNRFLITFPVSILISSVIVWLFTLSSSERKYIVNLSLSKFPFLHKKR